MLKPSYIFLVFFQLLLLTACSKNDPVAIKEKQTTPNGNEVLSDNMNDSSESQNNQMPKFKNNTLVNHQTEENDNPVSSSADTSCYAEDSLAAAGEKGNKPFQSTQFENIPESHIVNIENKVKRNLSILGVLIIIIGGLSYIFIRDFNELTTSHNNLSDALVELQKNYNKLAELNNQLVSNYNKISGKVSIPAADSGSDDSKSADNHRMSVTMAHEIFKLKKNVSNSKTGNDSENKKVIRSVEGLVEKLEKNGYEIVDLTGTDYTVEMNVNVIRYVSSDSMPSGKRVITKMIKPSVKYKGEVISPGDVEVTESTVNK